MEALLASVSDAVVSIDAAHRITRFNAAAAAVFGYAPDDAIGRDLAILLPPYAAELHPQEVREFGRASESWRRMGTQRGVVRGRRSDGSEFPARVTIFHALDPDPADHERLSYTAVVRDLSLDGSAAQMEHLSYLSTHDQLTGLPNRAQVVAAIADPDAEGPTTLICCGVDSYPALFQDHGRLCGEAVLRQITHALHRNAPEGAHLARFGEAEFIVVLPTPVGAELQTYTDRLRRALAGRIPWDDATVCWTVSTGATTFERPSAQAPLRLVRRAEQAMVRAQRAGGDRSELFRDADAELAERRASLARALARAPEDGSLTARYQPIVGLSSMTVFGFEALVRWSHEGRVLPPADFLPVAEDSGAIEQIDLWMLRRACRDLRALREAAGRRVRISVNFSARHFDDPVAPVTHVAQALEESGTAAEDLIIEVTETAQISHWDTAIRALNAIRALGCGVALDDFGTGHASLNYLLDLSASVVKIDRSYTLRAEAADPVACAVIRGLAHMARELGIRIVAEGIENEHVAATMRRLDADFGQGYLWARPLPLADAVDWLRARPAGTAIR